MTDSSDHALAIAAHPDDIEFMMAGTLLLLKESGCTIHMWNLGSGSCGTETLSREEIVRIRRREAQASAEIAGAVLHPPIADDIEIFYDHGLIRKAAAVVRDIRPRIILIPSPEDYMEDHLTTARITVTAAFVRGMINYDTDPPRPPWSEPTALYHAMPHGLRDQLRRRVTPDRYVDILTVFGCKRDMLACHASQKDWLDRSQGIGAYLGLMEAMCREVGTMSGRFELAEGWRRHLHWGFGPEEYDPLGERLGSDCYVVPGCGDAPG
ncbi:MAG: PIG-L family deacetylase [Candidatus Latescibacteria bacterium]|nr:PIG-L family deacetylase [Candidatus Latescibacterota bacterium]